VLLSLSISNANCERNLLPTLINDSFPGARLAAAAVLLMTLDLTISSDSNIRRSRSLELRSTRDSNDECSASLFFSINWFYDTNQHTAARVTSLHFTSPDTQQMYQVPVQSASTKAGILCVINKGRSNLAKGNITGHILGEEAVIRGSVTVLFKRATMVSCRLSTVTIALSLTIWWQICHQMSVNDKINRERVTLKRKDRPV